jgi:nucleoside-diphosphate-sugar epimerase
VFDALGRPLRVHSINPHLSLAMGALAETLARLWPSRPEPPLTRYGAMVAAWSQTFDLTAARTRLQWTPRHSPEDAIIWALQEGAHA